MCDETCASQAVHACRKVFGGYLDINIKMGTSIVRAYLKDLGKGIDGGWINQMPQTTLLTGVKQALIAFVGLHACRGNFCSLSQRSNSLLASSQSGAPVSLTTEGVAC